MRFAAEVTSHMSVCQAQRWISDVVVDTMVVSSNTELLRFFVVADDVVLDIFL